MPEHEDPRVTVRVRTGSKIEPVPALGSCMGFPDREPALTREPLGVYGRGHTRRAVVTAFSAPLVVNMANQLTVGAWLTHPEQGPHPVLLFCTCARIKHRATTVWPQGPRAEEVLELAGDETRDVDAARRSSTWINSHELRAQLRRPEPIQTAESGAAASPRSVTYKPNVKNRGHCV
ncbi:hypothetical protein EDF60_0028 [Leucobacter luti]|nr:hypothetical protein EDF60_0028 [Leucobacter luti]